MKRPDIEAARRRTTQHRIALQKIRDVEIRAHAEADAPSTRPGGGGYLYGQEERNHRHAMARTATLEAKAALNKHVLAADKALVSEVKAYCSLDGILERARFTPVCTSPFEDTRIAADSLEQAAEAGAFRALTILKTDRALAARIRRAADEHDFATLRVARLVRDARVEEQGAGKCALSGAAWGYMKEVCDEPEDERRMIAQATELESEAHTIDAVESTVNTGRTPEESNREKMLRWMEETRKADAAAAAAAAPKPTPAPTEPAITVMPPIDGLPN